jgi:hypothetical protein
MHNPYSAIYTDNTIPITTQSLQPPPGSPAQYADPPSAFTSNLLNISLLIMTVRVFCYEVRISTCTI